MTRAGTATVVDREMFPSAAGPVSVHSVFRAAANLATPAGLITLVAASRPAGPRTVVTDLAALDALALEPGQTGDLSATRLRLGALDLDLTGATAWRPTRLDGPIRRDAVDELAARLDGVRLGDGPTPPTAEPTPFQAAVAAGLAAGTRDFTDAVARRRRDDARTAATRPPGCSASATDSPRLATTGSPASSSPLTTTPTGSALPSPPSLPWRSPAPRSTCR